MEQEQWLGGYRLIRRLGSGGAGTVWLAEDEGGQRVALKLLHPALADTTKARARLAREATTVNRVRSSGVAHVVDVETEGVQPFVVTEFVSGPTLAVRLRSGALPPRDVAALAQSLLTTLEAVHSAHIVHRDVKPSNVILNPSGPVLIDFGIAMGEDDERLTSTGLVSGTAGYTAPEVLRGGEADQTTDWWSWAATLLEAAQGRPPFGGGDARAVIVRVLEDEPDLDGLPGVVADAFARALCVDPSERPDPHEVVDLLADPESWRSDPEDATRVISTEQDATNRSNATEVFAEVPGVDSSRTELLPPAPTASSVEGDVPVSPTRTMPVDTVSAGGVPAAGPAAWSSAQPLAASPPAQPASPWSSPAAGGLPWAPIQPYVAQRPRTTVGSGLVLMMALAALPAMAEGPGTSTALIIVFALSAFGAGNAWRERRRARFGSVRSSDTGMSLLALPLHLLRALAGELLGLVIGVVLAAAVWVLVLRDPSESLTWPLTLMTGSAVPSEAFEYTNSLQVLAIIWALSAIVLLVMWVLPTGRDLRDGMSMVVRAVLPPLWSRVVFCVIVVAILALTWFVISGVGL